MENIIAEGQLEMEEEINMAEEIYQDLVDSYEEYRIRNSLKMFIQSYSHLIKMQDYLAKKWDLKNSFKKDFLREV